MGYTSIWQQRISRPVAENFVCSQKNPFYIRGQKGRSGNGHAWVIDGWKAYDICHWLVTYDTRIKPGDGSVGVELYRNLLRREEICKAHCNFGWDGLCDGYYSFWLYDTTCYLPAGDADKSVGDKIGRDNSIFDTNLKMLTCLPNK